jgi:hypothetical protein
MSSSTRLMKRERSYRLCSIPASRSPTRCARLRLAASRCFRIAARARADRSRFRTTALRSSSCFGTANRSTLLHETGHIWLEELRADATAEDATDEDKADWETVSKWFAANGAAVTKSGFIPTQAHELWARGVERYFMEGKAPSASACAACSAPSARGCCASTGRPEPQHADHSGNPRGDGSPDRDAGRDRRRASPECDRALFKTAEEAGMTEAEFADYQSRVANARDEAYDALLYKTMEAIRRRKTRRDARPARSSIRAEVAQEINSQPQFRLLHLLRTGVAGRARATRASRSSSTPAG